MSKSDNAALEVVELDAGTLAEGASGMRLTVLGLLSAAEVLDEDPAVVAYLRRVLRGLDASLGGVPTAVH